MNGHADSVPSKEILSLETSLQNIRLLVTDVDGVLTDGRIVYDENGRELKFFDVRDGHGLVMLRKAGLETGILTGRTSEIVTRRAAELGMRYVVQGSRDKAGDIVRMAAEAGVPLSAVAYMGDDVVDLPALVRCGVAAAPGDAHPDVLANVGFVAEARGGRGAIRELCERILKAQGKWDAYLAGWLTV